MYLGLNSECGSKQRKEIQAEPPWNQDISDSLEVAHLSIASVELTKSEGWSQHAVVTRGKAEYDFPWYNCSPRVSHQEWWLFLLTKPHLERKQFSKALSLEMASEVKDRELCHIEDQGWS